MKIIYTLLSVLFFTFSMNAQNPWVALNSGTTNNLFDIFFLNDNLGYSVGDVGTIVKTTNGGTTWTTLNSGVTSTLTSIYFTDSLTGYASGNGGVIINTTDGGVTWGVLTSGTTVNLNYIGFINANTGFMVGGNAAAHTSTILKTNDAGITWTLQSSNSTRQKHSSFPSFNEGFSCGGGGIILKTTSITAGIIEINNNLSCDLFPNPSNGKFDILINNNTSEKSSITVFNTLGELIYKEETDKNVVFVDVSYKAKGIYFVEVKNEKGLTTKKIVIDK